ncbi:MAG: hypothetical protein K2Y56_18970 [Methylobacterium sp.]|uniref:hypothetical protein n=1 Tax=Methylobacterium sp. TaxID=409 RepID=UPI0025F5045C|nr:hypothetical protein [Methylobacterium sp.]MBX9933573.1 hypothetical protein [Methylobacterium sp.]
MATSSIKGSYVLFACQFARDTYCAVPDKLPDPGFFGGAGLALRRCPEQEEVTTAWLQGEGG